MTQPQVAVGDPAVALEGTLGDGNTDVTIRSYTNPTVETGLGRAVIQGANADEMALPSAAAQDFIGITSRQTIADPSQIVGVTDGIPSTMPANVVTSGRVWVHAEVAITLGDGVWYRHTSDGGSNTVVGRFRNDVDTANAQQLTHARWLSETTAVDQLALLELYHP